MNRQKFMEDKVSINGVDVDSQSETGTNQSELANHLVLLGNVHKGLDDVASGRTKDARSALASIANRRRLSRKI